MTPSFGQRLALICFRISAVFCRGNDMLAVTVAIILLLATAEAMVSSS